MRVLLLTNARPTTNIGGPGAFVPVLFQYLQSLAARHGALAVKAQMGQDGTLYATPEAIRYDVYREPSESLALRVIKAAGRAFFVPAVARMYVATVTWRRRCRSTLRNFKPDIVHVHDFYSAAFLPIDPHVPLVFTNHFKGSLYREFVYPTFPEFRSRLWRSYFLGIERRAIRNALVITFPSESARRLLLEDYPELWDEIERKSCIVYTGIPDPIETIPDNPRIEASHEVLVVNISNHIPDKGVDIALEVFAELLMLWPNARFINFGMLGSETERLRRLARCLGIASKVSFMGVQPKQVVLRVLSKAKVVLHTPRRTVFDLALLEAMALSRPVIVTATLGNLEAVGETYPLKVDVHTAKLDRVCIETLSNEAALEKIGRYLRQRYEDRFRVENMVERYVSLYFSVLERS